MQNRLFNIKSKRITGDENTPESNSATYTTVFEYGIIMVSQETLRVYIHR
jgi:hypothetical protein